MSEQELRDSISDDDLKLLGKSLQIWGNEGIITNILADFMSLLESEQYEDIEISTVNILTSEIIKRYSQD